MGEAKFGDNPSLLLFRNVGKGVIFSRKCGILGYNIKKGYLPADFFFIHGFNVSCDKCFNTHMKHIKKFLVVSNDKRTGRLETC